MIGVQQNARAFCQIDAVLHMQESPNEMAIYFTHDIH